MSAPPLNLKELMRVSYEAGREDALKISGTAGWKLWFERFGRERHDRFLEGSAEGDRTVE